MVNYKKIYPCLFLDYFQIFLDNKFPPCYKFGDSKKLNQIGKKRIPIQSKDKKLVFYFSKRGGDS